MESTKVSHKRIYIYIMYFCADQFQCQYLCFEITFLSQCSMLLLLARSLFKIPDFEDHRGSFENLTSLKWVKRWTAIA